MQNEDLIGGKMSSTVILKASGLITAPNQLDVPDGALTEADNIIIKRDGVIESRRGFKLHGDALPLSGDRVKQLFVYRDRILRHYDGIMQYDSTGTGTFVDFVTGFTEAVVGLRFKAVESNGNMYITSDGGIKKISSQTGEGLSTTDLEGSGGIKAVDLTSEIVFTYKNQTGFMPQDSTVAYRSLWNINDNNGNLIQGTPSQRSVVANDLKTILIYDLLKLLLELDNASDNSAELERLSDTDYSSTLGLITSDGATEIRQALVDLTAKLDLDIEYGNDASTTAIDLASTDTIEVVSLLSTYTRVSGVGAAFTDYLTSGSKITFSGTANTNMPDLNGNYIVSSVTSTTIIFNANTGQADVSPAETVNGTPVLNSNEYGSLVTPTVPSTPTTNNQLVQIQLYMSDIISRLQLESDGTGSLAGVVISATNQTDFINTLDVTTTSTVKLRTTIPDGITTDHFLQLYRSAASQAVGVEVLSDKSPSDELKLVYEDFVTSQNLTDGYIDVIDVTPSSFRGANLYTNPSTGEGITQANDIPPFAKDINRFRNVLFYANTKTRQRFFLNMLGVEDLIDQYTNSVASEPLPTLSISSDTSTVTYEFLVGRVSSQDILFLANTSNSLNNTYFDIYSANDSKKYRLYYDSAAGAYTPPITVDNEIPVKISLSYLVDSSASIVAAKTRDVINTLVEDFNAIDNTLPTITLKTLKEGTVTLMDSGTTGFAAPTATDAGTGENFLNRRALISNLISPAQAVDATARSLVRVINNHSNSNVYAYYLSGVADVPGKILIESKTLNDEPFYAVMSNVIASNSFSPNMSPEHVITGMSVALDQITVPLHGYSDGDKILLLNTTGTITSGTIDGFHVIEVVDPNTLQLPEDILTITGGSLFGTASSSSFAQISENENKDNRIYYSKYQQPESVPITNYFDVGAEDKPILRIFPLRDSLFVLKVDGVYRISGEVAPFNVQLFDSSTKLIAEDTVDVVDNTIYCWTEQGIAMITESNVSIVSRVIDSEILKIGSSNSVNFGTATWGKGYESDNSYTVYTVKDKEDITATIGYRYSTLTKTWTNIVKSPICGVVNESDDKMYLGASDINYIEIERKDFERTDYADRETSDFISNSNYLNGIITVNDNSIYSVGDVVTQNQTLTVFQYNSLLAQLDTDTALGGGYVTALTAVAGENLRTKMVALAVRLDADGLTDSDYASTIASQSFSISTISVNNPTIITTSTPHNLFTGRKIAVTGSNSNPLIDDIYTVTVTGASTFTIPIDIVGAGTAGTVLSDDEDYDDIKACYNNIINKINADIIPVFSNYTAITSNTIQESPIISINTSPSNSMTLRSNLDYMSGPITIYHSIPTSFTYAPNTMGDPLGLKHLREAQIIFDNRALTSATMEFATDILPQFEVVGFDLDGPGIFGSGSFGSGFFGGASNSVPFRTYIPRNSQYCTYIRVRVTHNTARESYVIYATTLTGEIGISSRTYR